MSKKGVTPPISVSPLAVKMLLVWLPHDDVAPWDCLQGYAPVIDANARFWVKMLAAVRRNRSHIVVPHEESSGESPEWRGPSELFDDPPMQVWNVTRVEAYAAFHYLSIRMAGPNGTSVPNISEWPNELRAPGFHVWHALWLVLTPRRRRRRMTYEEAAARIAADRGRPSSERGKGSVVQVARKRVAEIQRLRESVPELATVMPLSEPTLNFLVSLWGGLAENLPPNMGVEPS